MTNTQKEKVALLDKLMTKSKRNDETEFYHFTDEAPESLKDKFLESFEVRDRDYQIFSNACDIMQEIYSERDEEDEENEEDMDDTIYDRATEVGSVYNSDRLELIDIWNEEDIAQYCKDYSCSISQACAIWYDEQVKSACFIIKSWIDEE